LEDSTRAIVWMLVIGAWKWEGTKETKGK